jgi:flagellar biosynthesis GTPase FlhF
MRTFEAYQKWLGLSSSTVKNGVDSETGNRYIVEFAKHYKEVTGKTLCLSCRFDKSFSHFISKIKGVKRMPPYKTQLETKQETGFILKKKYQGVSLGFGSQEMLSNQNMTVEKAVKFYVEHKAGETLFDVVPENIEELVEAYKAGEPVAEEEATEEPVAEEEATEEPVAEEEATEEPVAEEEATEEPVAEEEEATEEPVAEEEAVAEELELTTKDFNAEEAIDMINNNSLDDLGAGFLHPSETRKTVLAAWKAKTS